MREKKTKYFISNPDIDDFGTIAEISEWMHKNGVPDYATVTYAGCGTHNIAFEWYEEEKEFFGGEHESNYDDRYPVLP